MKDVAEAAGVSRTTVSFVLNNLPHSNISEATRKRILQVARDLDYAPNTQALNLVTGRTMLLALVVRKTFRQLGGDAFLTEFMDGVIDVIEPEGYHLMVHTARPHAPPNTYRQLIRTRKVDGLLISAPLVDDTEVRLLHDEGTPIVLNGSSDVADIPTVDVDNRQGAFIAVAHLLSLGHRRIGHISNAPFTYVASCDRLAGYRQAVAEAGLPDDPALVREGNFTEGSGYEPMQALLDLPEPPTAVFVGSDTVALGALQAIAHRGKRVPDDISVIGFDNIPLGRYLNPPLTTVHLPTLSLGRRAGQILLRVIAGDPLPDVNVLLPTKLIIRHSTRRLN